MFSIFNPSVDPSLHPRPWGPAASHERGGPTRSTRIRNAFALLIVGLVLLSGAAHAGQETSNEAGSLAAAAPLDLNRATAAELEALPGIGEVKAAAILAVRDARGGFESIDELESVRGIGPSLVAKLRPLLRLGARSPQTGSQAANKK